MGQLKQIESVKLEPKTMVSNTHFFVFSGIFCSIVLLLSSSILIIIGPKPSKRELINKSHNVLSILDSIDTLKKNDLEMENASKGDENFENIKQIELQEGDLIVDWLKLEAKQYNGDVILMWLNSSENICQSYELERSFDRVIFEPISTKELNVSIDRFQSHIYTDEGIADNAYSFIYYRVKHIGIDQITHYSKTVSLDVSQKDVFVEFVIYPNPATDTLVVSINGSAHKKITINIYSIQGDLISQRTGHIQDFLFDVKKWPSGTYNIEVIGLTKDITQSIIKY